MSTPTTNVLGTQFICQIAMVVHDATDACAAFAEIMGMPCPTLWKANDDLSDKVTYRGSPSGGRVQLGFFSLANTVLEFIQPSADPTAWREHLEGRGPSVHHIAFKASPFGARIDSLVGQGYPLIQRGQRYAYVESEDALGFVLEPLDIPDPVSRDAVVTGVLGTDRIAGIGAVVKDLAVTIAAYQRLLGASGARIEVSDGEVGEKVRSAAMWNSLGQAKVAKLSMANLDLEVVELKGAAAKRWSDRSNITQGAHHLSFEVNDLHSRVERLVSLGYPAERQGDGWALIDTSARLGTRLVLRTS